MSQARIPTMAMVCLLMIATAASGLAGYGARQLMAPRMPPNTETASTRAAVLPRSTALPAPRSVTSTKAENPEFDSALLIRVSPKIHTGTCDQETCSLSKELGRTLVGESSRGLLLQIQLLSGEGAYKDGSNELDPNSIRWNSSPYDMYVFCSKSLPTVMSFDDGFLNITPLQLRTDGMVSRADEDEFFLYTGSCHPDVEESLDLESYVRRFEYRADNQLSEDIQPQLTRPTDILKH